MQFRIINNKCLYINEFFYYMIYKYNIYYNIDVCYNNDINFYRTRLFDFFSIYCIHKFCKIFIHILPSSKNKNLYVNITFVLIKLIFLKILLIEFNYTGIMLT